MANMTVKEDILGSETGEIGIEIRVSSFSFTNLIITSSQQSSSSPPPPPTTTTIRNLIEIQSNMEELRIENITMEMINCKENLIFSNLTFSDSTFHISNLNLQNVNTALHFFQLTSTQNILIYNLSLLNSSSSSAFSLMFNNLSSLFIFPPLPLSLLLPSSSPSLFPLLFFVSFPFNPLYPPSTHHCYLHTHYHS